MRPIANVKPSRAAPAQLTALLTFSITLLAAASCSGPSYANPPGLQVNPPTPDPRVGLAAGMFDAGEASWNLELLSATPPPEEFLGILYSTVQLGSG